MTRTDALRLALKALERGETKLRWEAITAIKESLAQPSTDYERGVIEAQPEQEPVAYIRKDQLQKAMQSAMLCEVTVEPRQDRIGIYTKPPQRQPEERTGWPPGLLQDDDRKLSKWLASKPDAKHVVDSDRNFCPRCGKRLASGFVEISIHTCTPPQIAADPQAFYGFPQGSVSTSNAGGKCVTAGETAPIEMDSQEKNSC